MPDKNNYDLSFRPESYWSDARLVAYFLSSIKGRARRAQVKKLLREGRASEIPLELLSESLPKKERERIGRIHPSLMGGEYLPQLSDAEDEVEIARIELNSVTWDVISIRARRSLEEDGSYLGYIRYRMVDEYDTEFEEWEELETAEPLTFGDLLDLLERWENPRDWNWEEGGTRTREYLEEMRDFASFSSSFYPQLSAYYEEEAQEWYEEWYQELGFDEEDEAEEDEKGEEAGAATGVGAK